MRKPEYVAWGLEVSKLELHADTGTGRTMTGYASAFDYPIPGDHGETILLKRGAFTKTLKEHTPAVLYHHGQDAQIGEKPLGRVRVADQDATGLWTETPLAETDYNENVIIPLLRDGTLNSMSIQFSPMQEDWNRDRTKREIREVALHEFGPTPFPRNLGATAALHSYTAALAGGMMLDGQADASEPEGRSGTLDADRLTWDVKITANLERWQREQSAYEERMARLTGRHGDGDHPRIDQGIARQA